MSIPTIAPTHVERTTGKLFAVFGVGRSTVDGTTLVAYQRMDNAAVEFMPVKVFDLAHQPLLRSAA